MDAEESDDSEHAHNESSLHKSEKGVTWTLRKRRVEQARSELPLYKSKKRLTRTLVKRGGW